MTERAGVPGKSTAQPSGALSLAVVLINWNNSSETISRARELCSWPSLRPKVIVVDNGSMEGSDERIESVCPDAVVVNLPGNKGYGGGNNAGIRKAFELGTDRILLLNSDASIDEKNASDLLRALDGNDGVGIVGPLLHEEREGRKMVSGGGRNIAIYPDTHRTHTVAADGTGKRGSLRSVDYVPGTVFLAKKSVYDSVGPLDEDFFFSGEIADFCFRAKRKSIACAVDTRCMAVHRKHGILFPREELHTYYSLRNRFLYVRKNCRNMKFLLLPWWGVLGAAMTVRSYFRGRRERARALSLAIRDGFCGRWGDRNELFDA